MDISEITTDIEAADEGVFFPFGEDCKIKIAQWGNKKHKKFLRKIYQKHGRKLDLGAISEEQANALQQPQWKHIVRDWEGITSNGQDFPYNEENLMALVKDKRYDSFFKKIEAIAKEEENFRESNIQDMGEDLPIT